MKLIVDVPDAIHHDLQAMHQLFGKQGHQLPYDEVVATVLRAGINDFIRTAVKPAIREALAKATEAEIQKN